MSKVKNSSVECAEFVNKNTEQAIEIVEDWVKEHPERTFQSDFFEKHPKAEKRNGVPVVCAKTIGYIAVCPNGNKEVSCRECWGEPIR